MKKTVLQKKSAYILVAGVMSSALFSCTQDNQTDTNDSGVALPALVFNTDNKEASLLTENLNNSFIDAHALDVTNSTDLINAQRGFISRSNQVNIEKDCPDQSPLCELITAWSLDDYQALYNPEHGDTIELMPPSPNTVNPSLWRNFTLNMQYGLFQVTNPDQPGSSADLNIYQVRGYDLSNITFIQTPPETGTFEAPNGGWLVLDPLISKETAKAALNYINTELVASDAISEALPVVAVLYSHSHIDHFGGVKGLMNNDQQTQFEKTGELPFDVIAPEGFLENAVSENVIAGNAMSRRAIYMYGSLTGVGEKKGVGAGLGLTTSLGEPTLFAPNIIIDKTTPIGCMPGPDYDENADCSDTNIHGLHVEFQMTPGTEAPAEMNTYFADTNALWMAENATNTMHNVLTLRGAEVRDPLIWSKFMSETITRWGDSAQVKFQSHHWPLWSDVNENEIVEYLEKQGDIYKYIHDQSVRLMNQGFIGEEISELIKLPETLESNWATRGYYGTLKHNSRAVYQRYMGWYSGNPSDLNNLPPQKVAKKYIEYMGGANVVLQKITQEIAVANNVGDDEEYNDLVEKNETYRWAAEVLKHVVFATHTPDDPACKLADEDVCHPDPTEAELLLADVYEQLGYQSESGPWRAVYLQGAIELREPKHVGGPALATASPDISTNMSVSMVWDFMSIQLDPVKLSAQLTDKGYTNSDKLFIKVTINPNPPVDPSVKPSVNEESNDDMTGTYYLTIRNSVLVYSQDEKDYNNADGSYKLSLEMDRQTLDQFLLGKEPMLCASKSITMPCIDYSGTEKIFEVLKQSITKPEFWFRIVTPRPEQPLS